MAATMTWYVAFALLIGLQTTRCGAVETRPQIYLGTGIKIGEVTATSAILWLRTTAASEPSKDGSCPGAAGAVKLTWYAGGESNEQGNSGWLPVDPQAGFTRKHLLIDLKPNTAYRVSVKTRAEGTDFEIQSGQAEFRTAPDVATHADIRFTVVTGQAFGTRDAGSRGHRIYESMLKIEPSFFIHTGDIVYYDRPGPLSKDIASARFKWDRMFSYANQVKFHNATPSYFMKDDHDILKDDCWPGQTFGDLTWEQGLAIFREQTPAPKAPYRTVRWGKNLQIWLLEGREFRSPNTMPNGPEKTILGAEQFDWLSRTTEESDASFKVVVSSTPIVGPDRTKKNDNHANAGFAYEGDRLRKLLASRQDLYVVCGDRHWQYVSVDPATNLREYSCGPTTDKHSGGWSDEQFDEAMHKFLRVQGGFLSVAVDAAEGSPRLAFRHHSVDGEVVHEESWKPQK